MKKFLPFFITFILLLVQIVSDIGKSALAQTSSYPDEEALRALLVQQDNIEVVVSELTIQENWAVGTIVEKRFGRFVDGSGIFFIGLWDGLEWQVYYEGSHDFRYQLKNIPDTILSPEIKMSLDYENSEMQVPLIQGSLTATGYKLPYPAGIQYYVSRAWSSGSCNHGSQAVDFVMPLNSTIVAARSGVVHTVIEDRNICGCVSSNGANYIVIRHQPDDGLYDYYVHIAQNGALVNVGDSVLQGQTIALSHQIGYTCGSSTCAAGTCPSACNPGAHLHFHIQNSSGQRVYTSFDDVGAIVGCNSYTSGNYFDQQPPLTTLDLSGVIGLHNWFISDVTVALSASDDVSGVAYSQYNLNSAGWVTYSDPILISNNGFNTLQYQSIDNAGNWEFVKSALIKIDTIAPTGSILILNGWETSNLTFVNVNTFAEDNASGLGLLRLRDTGNAWSDWIIYNSTSPWVLPPLTGQTITIEVEYQDFAGNISQSYADSIFLDIYPQQPSSANYRLLKSTFGMSATDAVSPSFSLKGTLSQVSVAGYSESEGYRIIAGYWSRLTRWIEDFWNSLPLVMK